MLNFNVKSKALKKRSNFRSLAIMAGVFKKCLLFFILGTEAQSGCKSEVEAKKCEAVCETKLFECFSGCQNDLECSTKCNREHVACTNECPCHTNCPDGCPCPVCYLKNFGLREAIARD